VGATGEVGLLGEEAAQRLLAIFAEAAGSCLAQIHIMSLAHGESKYSALYNVGLDLVQRWDREVVQEEAVRIETAYPEVASLHSYAFLWLLDRLCEDAEMSAVPVPPLSEIYAAFMRRVANHADTRRGRDFLEWPELCRRTVYVDAFRAAYHDFLHRRGKAHGASLHATLRARREPCVVPEEAASQVAEARPFRSRALRSAAPSDCSTAKASSATKPPSALHMAMQRHAPFTAAAEALGDAKSPVRAALDAPSESGAPEVGSPCFFAQENEPTRYIVQAV
jgi:hypothetical protein